MMKVDLHIHTTASDGRLTPEEVVHIAAKQGLSVIAITDHDSLAGIEPALLAAESVPSLRVIPGLEINTDTPNAEVHILGYFIDYRNKGLNQTLERLRNSREARARKIVAKLGELGIDIAWHRVLELSGGGSVGRPHIAQAMFERGYIPSFQEAFIKYIGRQGPAYVKRERLSPQEAAKLVVKAGGLPVLAHPANIDDLEELLVELKEAGLVGLEAYYNGYHRKVIDRLVSLAAKHGLIISGGSDFHGLGGDNEAPLGGIDVPFDCAERLIALAERRSQEVIR
ncbi:MAG: PHP domain-containing protein [Dehalococcoidia bacterium]|nr:PHP domain-containing protein [Dehalococcoidia bacterium]